MNLDLLLPFARDHAVQSVVMAAEWQGELSDQTLLRIHALQKKFESELPKVDLQKTMQISLNPSEGLATQPYSSLGGVVFQKTTPLGGVERQLLVNRQSCTFVLNDYVRWAPTLSFAMGLLQHVVPIILADKAISAIGLQYTDVFTWKDDPSLLELRKVLNDTSNFLPANVYDLENAWHSHHGFIDSGSHEVEKDRLTNINVNVLDVAGERTIQITTAHRANLKKPLRLSTANFLEVIESLQNTLHQDSKTLLASVLSDAVATKIRLK